MSGLRSCRWRVECPPNSVRTRRLRRFPGGSEHCRGKRPQNFAPLERCRVKYLEDSVQHQRFSRGLKLSERPLRIVQLYCRQCLFGSLTKSSEAVPASIRSFLGTCKCSTGNASSEVRILLKMPRTEFDHFVWQSSYNSKHGSNDDD